jgi:broad specificity phosphatase PhoE
MSDLQCPVTLLLAPYDDQGDEQRHELARVVATDRVSRVYSGPQAPAVQTTRAVAELVGTASEVRAELAAPDVVAELHAIADLHRGETVLVVLSATTLENAVDALLGRRGKRPLGAPMSYGSVVEMVGDADGWTRRTRDIPRNPSSQPGTDGLNT